MDDPLPGEVTLLLRQAGAGNDAARERVWAIVHADLRRIAGALMRREGRGHTLDPTALVHEAALRLLGDAPPALESRRHFLAIAARVMRRVLVEHARARGADRRGGAWRRVTLDGDAAGPALDVNVLDLHAALERLAAESPRAAQVVELRWFGGMTNEEVASELSVSERTVKGDWFLARAWLQRELEIAARRPDADPA